MCATLHSPPITHHHLELVTTLMLRMFCGSVSSGWFYRGHLKGLTCINTHAPTPHTHTYTQTYTQAHKHTYSHSLAYTSTRKQAYTDRQCQHILANLFIFGVCSVCNPSPRSLFPLDFCHTGTIAEKGAGVSVIHTRLASPLLTDPPGGSRLWHGSGPVLSHTCSRVGLPAGQEIKHILQQ